MYLRMHVNDHKFKIWGLENVYLYTHEECHFSFSPKISKIKM